MLRTWLGEGEEPHFCPKTLDGNKRETESINAAAWCHGDFENFLLNWTHRLISATSSTEANPTGLPGKPGQKEKPAGQADTASPNCELCNFQQQKQKRCCK